MMYCLNEDKTYRVCTAEEWIEQLEHLDRNVGDDIINNYHVSTLWFGIDYNHLDGVPLLFETMVFDKVGVDTDIYMMRYSTWEQAVEGHKMAVQWAEEGCKCDG